MMVPLVNCRPSRHAKPFIVIHRSPNYNSDLNKSSTVCKVGDLEVPPKPFWVWRHIHVHKVHVYEVYAHEVHAYELHAREVHAREVHACEMNAHEVHACEMHVYEVHTHM